MQSVQAGDANDLKPALIELIVAHTTTDQDSQKNMTMHSLHYGSSGPEVLSDEQKKILDNVPEALVTAEAHGMGQWGLDISSSEALRQGVISNILSMVFSIGNLRFFRSDCRGPVELLELVPMTSSVHECHNKCMQASTPCLAYSVSANPVFPSCAIFNRSENITSLATHDTTRICFTFT